MSEWIKVEHNVHEKVEVATISELTGLDQDAVVGKLIKVWAWASRNCNSDGVTAIAALRIIREITRCETFDEAMGKCGWLVIKGDKITFTNFDRHNSQTAKERALMGRRVARHRGNADVTQMKRSERYKSVTRIDKNNSGGCAPAKGLSCI